MKRILLDQGLAPLAAAILRESGWDALHVSEAGLQSADDIEILNAARHDGRICITLDHDFHSHLELTGADSPSVVFLRIQGLDAREQASFIRASGRPAKTYSPAVLQSQRISPLSASVGFH